MEWYDRPYNQIVYTLTETWETVDISAFIPEGTEAIALLIVNMSGTYERRAGARRYGSTDEDTSSSYDRVTQLAQVPFYVGVSTDRKIDVFGTPGDVVFYILASFNDAEVEFLTNRVLVTPSGTYDWYDVDLSAYLPDGAEAAMFKMTGYDLSNPVGLRRKGSTNDFTNIVNYFTGACIGVDLDKLCQMYRRASGSKLWLMGWVKHNHGLFHSDLIQIGGGTYNYYEQNLSWDMPPSAHGVVIEVRVSGTYSRYYDLRKLGDTEEIYKRCRNQGYHPVKLSEAGSIEYKQSSNSILYVVGYFMDLPPLEEDGVVEIESEIIEDENREEGLVEAESEVLEDEYREEGLVEIESEVRAFEGTEYGMVIAEMEIKSLLTFFDTRQIVIESEVLKQDLQHYIDFKEIDCQAIVRAKVPAPTAPNLTGRVPSPGETLVRRNQPASFILFSGNDDDVDIDTVQVTVNGHLYLKGDPEFSYTGNFSRYNIEVAHPVWEYEEMVSVVINASSRLGVAMDEVSYSFTVEWIDVLTRTGLGKIEFYEPGQYVLDILTIQEDWVRQGAIRETLDLELWYGRYMKLPKVEDVEIAVLAGDKESLGKEVLENGYFSIKVGSGAYTKMYSDTIVHLGPMFANTKKTLRFKLDVPLGAVTKKYTMLELQIIPKMLRSWARFPWGIGIYNSDVNLFDFHPNQVVYRAYVFDNIMWQTLEEAGIVTSPFYRGEDKQW